LGTAVTRTRDLRGSAAQAYEDRLVVKGERCGREAAAFRDLCANV